MLALATPLSLCCLHCLPAWMAGCRDVEVCFQLAKVLGRQPEHSKALQQLEQQLIEQLAPLGIRTSQRLAAGDDDDTLSEPSLPSYSEDEGWESNGGGEVPPLSAAAAAAAGAAARAEGEARSFRQHWNRERVVLDRLLFIIQLVRQGIERPVLAALHCRHRSQRQLTVPLAGDL